MKIALIDDEQMYLDEMERICRDFGEKNGLKVGISAFQSAESFLGTLGSNIYSVVFMDVYMSGINGVRAAQRLREYDRNCLLIFLTTSGEHMPEAFSCHAFEYIQKPFTRQRVTDVLNDALKIIPVQTKYVDLYCERKNVRVTLDEIVSVVTDAHYISIETSDGKQLRCRMTMAQFMERAADPRFILVNKGIAVNADHIVGFENSCCLTDNGARYPIRVRDRLKIEQAVRNYNFDRIRSRQRYGE